MKKQIRYSGLFAAVTLGLPGWVGAVAVPDELIKQSASHEGLYGAIIMVFIVGIVLGAWINRRLL